MGQSRNTLCTQPATSADEPTLGDIKRALHDLSRGAHGTSSNDTAAILREINELVRRVALLGGIDPDQALRRSRESLQSRRERMATSAAAAPDPASA